MKFSRLLLIAAALGAAVIIVLFVVLDVTGVFRLGHPFSSAAYGTKTELVKDWDKSAPWLPDDATDSASWCGRRASRHSASVE